MIKVMEKQMYATVSDSRGEEFAASAGWINRFLRRNNFTCRRMPENLEAGEVCDIFIADLCEEGIKRLSQIAALSQINAAAIIWYCTVW